MNRESETERQPVQRLPILPIVAREDESPYHRAAIQVGAEDADAAQVAVGETVPTPVASDSGDEQDESESDHELKTTMRSFRKNAKRGASRGQQEVINASYLY